MFIYKKYLIFASMIQTFNIPYGTTEWHQFRQKGIGGSEAGVIMNQCQYGDIVILYYTKVGVYEKIVVDNEAMLSGRDLEDYIADKRWAYWEGTPESVIINRANNNIIRTSEKIEGYCINNKYPHLFASVDRIGNKIIDYETGEVFNKKFVLEIKTIGGYESKKWEAKYPPQYYWQVLHYMIVFELDYAEIAVLRDGKYFSVHPIHYNKEDADRYIKESKKFWDRVITGREVVKAVIEQDLGEPYTQQILDSELDKYAPQSQGGKEYEEFMSERHKLNKDLPVLKGTNLHISLLRDYAYCKDMSSVIDSHINTIKAHLIRIMSKNQVEQIDCDHWGRIDYKLAKQVSTTKSLIPRPTGAAKIKDIREAVKAFKSLLITKI